MRKILTLAVLAAFSSLAPAAADERVPPVTDPVVKRECGSCHMAFPPAFLPVRSWDRIMAGLADHFGEDASLPEDQAQAIRAYLTANAGDSARQRGAARFMRWVAPGGAPLRITENPEFLRRHNFPDRVWRDPQVVTKSNCAACHRGAEQGWFGDD